ncbi:MAG: GyrI-like domain-containing protein [Limnochordia bacterium]|jgi:hypothetical protein|nr:GyrI-like domain-containing protein [Bacillota bacterium]HOB09532.1 GyrI-like domain-containing protein [Limnochordia bacterium]NLH31523.1 GyrI-like domain-containing protein [Bacillota bacterium]HPT93274.1 GyrI-like domain-containing protein [Limnochordia bacterium]HPZ30824.1 GyrI-like domain-containing protein [Limnochordia bacterium]
MAEVVNVYKQNVPAMRFIGRKYGDEDRVEGTFGAKWGECFDSGMFETLEGLAGDGIPGYEDSGAYVGLMRWKQGEPFEYWIGMFVPENTPVPEGLDSVDFPAGSLGVCWVYGFEHEVYGKEGKCARRLKEEGFEVKADEHGAYWFFERYACPRFTDPDEEGKIILDICHFV